MTRMLRWLTFITAAVPTIGLLYSMVILFVVWESNLSSMLHGDIPKHLLSDCIKAIIFLGYYVSAGFIGFNACYPDNKHSQKIWVSLIVFYTLSAISFIFPQDVNPDVKSGLFVVPFFYMFLIALCALNLWLSQKQRKA